MTIVSCPSCQDQVRLPDETCLEATVRCPLCAEEYLLSEAVNSLPPELIVVAAPESLAASETRDEDYSALLQQDTLTIEEDLAEAETEAPAFDLDKPRPRSKSTSSRSRRSARKPKSPLMELVKIVAGGVVGLTLGQLILWWGFSKDPFKLAPKLNESAPWILPDSLRAPVADQGGESDATAAGEFAFGAVEEEPSEAQQPPARARRNKRGKQPRGNQAAQQNAETTAAQLDQNNTAPADTASAEPTSTETGDKDKTADTATAFTEPAEGEPEQPEIPTIELTEFPEPAETDTTEDDTSEPVIPFPALGGDPFAVGENSNGAPETSSDSGETDQVGGPQLPEAADNETPPLDASATEDTTASELDFPLDDDQGTPVREPQAESGEPSTPTPPTAELPLNTGLAAAGLTAKVESPGVARLEIVPDLEPLSSQERETRLDAAEAADKDWDDVANPTTADVRRLATVLYRSLATLGEGVTRAPGSDTQTAAVEALLKKISQNKDKLALLEKVAPSWMRASRPHNGVALCGTVVEVRKQGTLIEAQVEVYGPQLVTVVSARPESGVIKQGQTAVVLGLIVENPELTLPGYRAPSGKLVLSGHHFLINRP